MLEFLASEMGFTIFAIEDDMPEAEQIDDYIQTGAGDPKALVLKLFPVWQTQEVLDLVLWMRRYNESGKGRLHFAGFDMQNEIGAQRIVADFVKKHVPDYVQSLAGAYDGAPGDIGRAEEVLQHLENNRERLLKSVDHRLIERAVENARVVVQNRTNRGPLRPSGDPLRAPQSGFFTESVSLDVSSISVKLPAPLHNQAGSRGPSIFVLRGHLSPFRCRKPST
jgi:erythromycin esterase-like protein